MWILWIYVFFSINICIFTTTTYGLGYTRLTRNSLKKRESDSTGTVKDLDTDGKYIGEYNSDCTETLFISPIRKEVHFEIDKDVLETPKVKCHWNIIGTEFCIPVLHCKKFKLKPDVPGAETPCEQEHLQVTDGSRGLQRFCGDDGPKDLTTTKGLRDLYITFKSAEENTLKGRSLKCAVTCTSPGSGNATAIQENTEADVSEDCTCGRKPNANRIVGGQDAKRGEFPWIVGMVTSNTRRPFCGGTIISNRFILTAAHCLKGDYQNAHNFQILMNSRVMDLTFTSDLSKTFHNTTEEIAKLAKEDADDGGVRFNVDRYFIHPLYVRQTNDYDVALVRLKEPIDFKKYGAIIQPACIPPLATYNKTYENDSAVVAGWGLSSANSSSTMTILQKLDVRIFSTIECKSFYNERVSRRMMCAGFKEGGKDSCKGDSGGPLIAEKSPQVWELIGVVSWGEGCAASKSPGVYQRVSEVNQWIRYISNLENGVWCSGGG